MPRSATKFTIDSLGDEGKFIYNSLNKKLDTLINKFTKCDEMQTEMATLKELLTDKCNVISKLEDKVCTLETKIAKLESTFDDEDAYVRRDTVIFNGTEIPPSTPGEICSNIIRDVIKKKLKINLQPSDISVAHRSGKKPLNQTPDRRGIHVKFCRRDTKREIMMTKRDNSDPQHTLYNNDCLTPKRRTILFALRQMKKKFPGLVKGCTTQDGRVYAYTPPPASAPATARDRKHLIITHDALVEFCREFVKLPLDTFLDSWNH